MKEYDQLLKAARNIRTLKGIISLLHWDQETYMPSGSNGIRSEQIELLSGIMHREHTGKTFSNTLGKLVDLKSGKPLVKGLNKAELKEFYRDYKLATALPVSFVEEFARLTSESALAWQEARKKDDFQLFLPHLEKIIAMCKKKADLIGYKNHPYDALLDEYEPGMTTKEVANEFSSLKKSIVSLLKKIQGSKQVNDSFLKGNFSEKKQMEFAEILLKGIEFDKTKGRLDLSTHPFSSSTHPSDSRITSRIHKNEFMSHIRSVMHECGHSFYEMGLPEDKYGSPLGDAISLGIHESQSRFWETRIGLSKPFWKHFLPQLKEHFKLNNVTLDSFYKAINKVSPSFIRVEADEVTYPLHVILRFELETELINGKLKVKDIPEAWNGKMQELLGITPPNNTLGCLQDIHWSLGSFGYFPTYTLGNMYAAHLFTAFEKAFPKWEEKLAKGEIHFIHEWLTENIHRHGKAYTGKELLKNITGKPFSADAYNKYLSDKYKSIYGF